MSEPFLGQINIVGFNFANRGWANCDGQLLSIAQYSALFSLFGTMYGGDGRTTFGLPELRGRVPVHVGNGPGLPNPGSQGAKGGSASETLNASQVPGIRVGGEADQATAAGGYPANAASYASSPAASGVLGGTNGGGTQSHNNMQPYQVLRYLVAMQGIFPSRS